MVHDVESRRICIVKIQEYKRMRFYPQINRPAQLHLPYLRINNIIGLVQNQSDVNITIRMICTFCK